VMLENKNLLLNGFADGHVSSRVAIEVQTNFRRWALSEATSAWESLRNEKCT
jgi:hypothetical protein